MIIELSDGNTKQVLTTIDGGNQNSWVQDTFNIQQFFPVLTANMQLIVTCSDQSGSGHLVEGAIDQFEVESKAAIVSREVDLVMNTGYLIASPNPVNENTVIEYDLGDYRTNSPLDFQVRDLTGRVVYTKSIKQYSEKFNLTLDLPTGAYIAAIVSDEGTLSTFKLIKK